MQIKVSKSVSFGLILLFFLAATGICSADSVNVDIVSQFSEDVFDVAVVGSYAYIGQGQDFVVLDIIDVANPSEVGRITAPSEVNDIAVSGNYAYLANGDNGISVVDIVTPSSPVLVGSYDTDGYARDIDVSGNYACVADSSSLVIVDVSNPSSPTLAGTYDTIGFANGVTVSGNYAYVADDGKGIFDGSNGLVTVDISNPSSPSLVGTYDVIYAYSTAVSGTYAYVADSSGLTILDISNPSSPTFAGNYLSDGDSNGVAVSGNYAYVADGNGLVIIDVSTPSSPVSMGNYDGSYAYDVAVSGDYAYVADSSNGLVIAKIHDLAGPGGSGGNSTVTPGDEADERPIISGIGDKSVNENELLTFTVSATDAEGDAIVYSALDMPAGATLDATTGVFSWTPDTEGNYQVTFTAEANGLTDSETVTIVVLASDDVSSESQISNPSGEDISSSSVTLTWTSSSDVALVEVYRNDILIGNVTGSASTYKDTGLDSDTSYAYSLLPYYTNGTQGNMVSITLSTSSSSSGGGGSSGGSSTKSSSSGGGGGGGGGAGSVEDFENVAMKDVATAYLRMDSNVTYEFSREGNDIQSISLYSLKNSGEIISTIEVLNNRSKLVNDDAAGLVYKYINIWVGKSGFATEANMKDAVIKFKVNNSWIEDMSVSSESIRLQRYDGTSWEVLPTTVVSNTEGYVIFESQTPGFSPFAITADTELAASVSNNTDTKLQATGSENLLTDPIQTESADHGQTEPEKSNFWTLIMAVLAIGLVAVGYMYTKKN